MKKNNRKGFTIVELVIVIAVIAILAGVLIPTFASVVSNAKESAALQEARNLYTEYVSFKNAEVEDVLYINVDEYYFIVEYGKMKEEPVDSNDVPADAVVVTTETITPAEDDADADADADAGANG